MTVIRVSSRPLAWTDALIDERLLEHVHLLGYVLLLVSLGRFDVDIIVKHELDVEPIPRKL